MGNPSLISIFRGYMPALAHYGKEDERRGLKCSLGCMSSPSYLCLCQTPSWDKEIFSKKMGNKKLSSPFLPYDSVMSQHFSSEIAIPTWCRDPARWQPSHNHQDMKIYLLHLGVHYLSVLSCSLVHGDQTCWSSDAGESEEKGEIPAECMTL